MTIMLVVGWLVCRKPKFDWEEMKEAPPPSPPPAAPKVELSSDSNASSEEGARDSEATGLLGSSLMPASHRGGELPPVKAPLPSDGPLATPVESDERGIQDWLSSRAASPAKPEVQNAEDGPDPADTAAAAVGTEPSGLMSRLSGLLGARSRPASAASTRPHGDEPPSAASTQHVSAAPSAPSKVDRGAPEALLVKAGEKENAQAGDEALAVVVARQAGSSTDNSSQWGTDSVASARSSRPSETLTRPGNGDRPDTPRVDGGTEAEGETLLQAYSGGAHRRRGFFGGLLAGVVETLSLCRAHPSSARPDEEAGGAVHNAVIAAARDGSIASRKPSSSDKAAWSDLEAGSAPTSPGLAAHPGHSGGELPMLQRPGMPRSVLANPWAAPPRTPAAPLRRDQLAALPGVTDGISSASDAPLSGYAVLPGIGPASQSRMPRKLAPLAAAPAMPEFSSADAMEAEAAAHALQPAPSNASRAGDKDDKEFAVFGAPPLSAPLGRPPSLSLARPPGSVDGDAADRFDDAALARLSGYGELPDASPIFGTGSSSGEAGDWGGMMGPSTPLPPGFSMADPRISSPDGTSSVDTSSGASFSILTDILATGPALAPGEAFEPPSRRPSRHSGSRPTSISSSLDSAARLGAVGRRASLATELPIDEDHAVEHDSPPPSADPGRWGFAPQPPTSPAPSGARRLGSLNRGSDPLGLSPGPASPERPRTTMKSEVMSSLAAASAGGGPLLLRSTSHSTAGRWAGAAASRIAPVPGSQAAADAFAQRDVRLAAIEHAAAAWGPSSSSSSSSPSASTPASFSSGQSPPWGADRPTRRMPRPVEELERERPWAESPALEPGAPKPKSVSRAQWEAMQAKAASVEKSQRLQEMERDRANRARPWAEGAAAEGASGGLLPKRPAPAAPGQLSAAYLDGAPKRARP